MTEDVRITAQKRIGRITLTRPSALQALNAPMCESILSALERWAGDPTVHLVMIEHEEGTRGFCAGGDIRMLAESGAGDAHEARAFFNIEYRMNAALEAFPKPVLAIMDGVTMGGGVGLSVHGSHRVATERTVFAMPETGIGLFPDVGGGWFLPRLSGALGTWLALTGARLKGADVANLLNEILRGVSHAVPAGSFEAHREIINRCFAPDTAEAIIAALEADGSDWAGEQVAALSTKSPETVKVALRQLREGERLASFEDNMRMEYRIGWRKVQSADFLEGVRAVIVDKDNSPSWSPARLEDVTEADVARYFEPLGADELQFD